LSRREAYRLICMIAERDYADIVERTVYNDESARVFFVDRSFLEIWFGSS